MPHSRRHSTERAGLEHEHASAVLAFIADFDILLYADEKIVDPRMQVRRYAASGLDAVYRRLYRRVLVQHSLLTAQPTFLERDIRNVFDGDDGFLTHEVSFLDGYSGFFCEKAFTTEAQSS